MFAVPNSVKVSRAESEHTDKGSVKRIVVRLRHKWEKLYETKCKKNYLKLNVKVLCPITKKRLSFKNRFQAKI